jgi:hypothetical protein
MLQSPPDSGKRLTGPLTPPRLLGLFDKVKAFPLLRVNHPDVVAGVDYRDLREQPLVSDCGDYEIKLAELFRFPEQDTIVFHILITNRSDNPLDHSPEQLQVRVGDHVFTPSLTDLASGIPPHESTLGYVLVSGSPAGRNDLSLKNDFTFVLTRRDTSPEPALPDGKDVEPTPIPQ